MKKIIKYFMSIRHAKPTIVEQEFILYMDNLKKKYPNDADLGKHIRNN